MIVFLLAMLFFLLAMPFLFMPLNNEKRNVIYRKFHDGLLKICEDEKIFIHVHNNIDELNKNVYGDVDKPQAAGVYRYRKIYKDGDELPAIHFQKNSTFVLAHEVGHHFGIKYFENDSEEFADKYIYQLAKRILTKSDIGIINIEINVFAKCNIPFYYYLIGGISKLFRHKKELTDYLV